MLSIIAISSVLLFPTAVSKCSVSGRLLIAQSRLIAGHFSLEIARQIETAYLLIANHAHTKNTGLIDSLIFFVFICWRRLLWYSRLSTCGLIFRKRKFRSPISWWCQGSDGYRCRWWGSCPCICPWLSARFISIFGLIGAEGIPSCFSANLRRWTLTIVNRWPLAHVLIDWYRQPRAASGCLLSQLKDENETTDHYFKPMVWRLV